MYETHWLRIYRRLAFFSGHLPTGVVAIREQYVDDYHLLLGELEHLSGLNLQSYTISQEYLKPVKISQSPDNDHIVYSQQRFIDMRVMQRTFKNLANYFDQKFADLA